MNDKIGAALVTFNRLSCLKTALERYEAQTVPPAYILVVDNASTDGTGEFLDSWKRDCSKCRKYVISNDRNLGGSGGFYTALKAAQELEADWIWVADDDAYPHPDALEQACRAIRALEGKKNLAAICGQVKRFGKTDLQHRRNVYQSGCRLAEDIIPEEMYQEPYFSLNAFSYIGVVLNREKLLKAGLPLKEYFIWYDDTEHSLRMAGQGEIVCVPAVQIDHDVKENPDKKTDWRLYYGRRNRLDLIRRHFSKGCFYYNCAKQWVRITFFMRGEERKLAKAALKSAWKGTLGVSSVYCPGWKPGKGAD